MELTASHIASACFEKGIEFCLYKFPDAHEIKLALPESFCAKNSSPSFVITPFPVREKVSTINLKVATFPFSSEHWNKINSYQDSRPILPKVPMQESKEDYVLKMHQYFKAFESGRLQKAILSRVIRLDRPSGWDPFAIFNALCAQYPNTFVSCFYSKDGGLWLGASPELLVYTTGKIIQTVALAATQPRNENGIYEWGEKEKEEHDFVRRHIEHIFLKNGCALHQSKGPYTTEAAMVAHLKTDYTFLLGASSDFKKLLSELHPTPAIGGLPVKAALDCIAKFENYSRNFYTGYIGEINEMQESRLYINLRCMQVDDNHIALYVGGGISADSNPKDEWKETIQKSLTLRQIWEDK